MNILIKTKINKNYQEVASRFNLDLFKSLKPPLLDLNVIRFDGCTKGDEVHLEVGLGPVKKKWISLIVEDFQNEKEITFVDVGKTLPPPLKTWKHTHRILNLSQSECEIQDDIEYYTSNIFLDYLIYPAMYLQFALRKPAYKKFFRD